jgi:hypothetical protein
VFLLRNWQVTLLLYTLGVFSLFSSLKLYSTTRLSRGFLYTKNPPFLMSADHFLFIF